MDELVLDVSFKGMLATQRQIGVWPQSFTDMKAFIKYVIFVKYYYFFFHSHASNFFVSFLSSNVQTNKNYKQFL
jgi:hypothetical protein